MMSGFVAMQLFATAHAAEWTIDPSIELASVYDDNVRLATEEDSVSSWRVVPRLAVEGRTEVARTILDAYVAYSDYDEDEVVVEDKVETSAFLRSERRTSERVTLGFNGQYRRETLFKRVDFGPGIGDPQDVDVAITDVTDVQRYYRVADPYVRWRWTERTTFQLGYRFTDANFSREQGTGLVDYRDSTVQVSAVRALTTRMEGTLTIRALRFDPEERDESDTIEALAGVRYAFSETLQGRFAIGASRTEQERDGATDRSNDLVFTMGLEQRSELSRLDGLVSSRVTPGGLGEAVRSNQIRLRWERRTGQQVFFVLTGQALDIQALEGSTGSVDRRYYDVEPQVRWRWLEDWSVFGGYRYRRQKFDEGEAATSHSVVVGIRWEPVI